MWIEEDDRRYYVIEVSHDGHASGPEAEEFGAFITELRVYMDDPEEIARLYNALMQNKQSKDFNPRSLNLSVIDTPTMKQIQNSSQEVLLVRLEELLAERNLFAIPLGSLQRLFTEDLNASPNRSRHMMPELGWRQERVKWGGIDHARVIWVKNGYQLHRGRVLGPDGYDQPVYEEGPLQGALQEIVGEAHAS